MNNKVLLIILVLIIALVAVFYLKSQKGVNYQPSQPSYSANPTPSNSPTTQGEFDNDLNDIEKSINQTDQDSDTSDLSF